MAISEVSRSVKVSHFAKIYFHCGSADDISTDDKIQGLKRQLSVVRPICSACLAEGKEPSVRGGEMWVVKVERNEK